MSESNPQTAGAWRPVDAKLLNRFHDSLDNLKKVVETLMEQGILTYEMEATKTRPSKVYVLLE